MEGKKGISEDWLSLWMGLFIFVLGLGMFVGMDLLGWGIKLNIWTDLNKSLSSVSGTLKGMPGFTSLFLTYLFMLFLTMIGAVAMGVNAGRFILGFTLIFWISFGCFLLGHYAHFAANTPEQLKSFGITWSLKLTGEGGFIVALLAGLLVGNFFPGAAKVMQDAAVAPIPPITAMPSRSSG